MSFEQNVGEIDSRKPTFAEFVQYIIDEDSEGQSPDMHWAPVYKFCSLCQVKHWTLRMATTFY